MAVGPQPCVVRANGELETCESKPVASSRVNTATESEVAPFACTWANRKGCCVCAEAGVGCRNRNAKKQTPRDAKTRRRARPERVAVMRNFLYRAKSSNVF